MSFLGPKLEPGRIFHYPYDFGPPSGVMNKFLIVVDCQQVFYRVFVINTSPTEWQQENPELMSHMINIDKAAHAFLEHDSFVNCSQLQPVRIRDADQHVRETPRDLKSKISAEVRDRILKVVKGSRLLTAAEKISVIKSLSRA